MYEEEDTQKPYIPWALFDDLRNEKNYRYSNVQSWRRMKSRVWEKYFGNYEMPEPNIASLRQEIERSQFGDLLSYLAKQKIVTNITPRPISWPHIVPKAHYIQLRAPEELQNSEHTRLVGTGASFTSFPEALSKAIGELLERYFLLTPFFDKKKVKKTTFSDKNLPPALLLEIPRFFEWQLKYVRTGLSNAVLELDKISEATVHCVKGESISRNKKVLLPVQHIIWGQGTLNGLLRSETHYLSPRTTSGAGGGFTLTDATLSGLCELIERDGFLIFWLNKLSPRRIFIDKNDHSYFSSRFLEIYNSLIDRGYEIYFLDTTTDICLPSTTCVILSPLTNGLQAVTVTGKCHPDPAKTLDNALLEHIAFLHSFDKSADIIIPGASYVPFTDKEIDRKERLAMWRSGKMTDKIKFFLTGKKIPFAKWKNEFPPAPLDQEPMLYRVLGEFKRMESEEGSSYEVFRYEVRHNILDELNYHVVKMVVPALIPLYLRENSAPLDSERLRRVPKKLGLSPSSIDSYNPSPHPFP